MSSKNDQQRSVVLDSFGSPAYHLAWGMYWTSYHAEGAGSSIKEERIKRWIEREIGEVFYPDPKHWRTVVDNKKANPIRHRHVGRERLPQDPGTKKFNNKTGAWIELSCGHTVRLFGVSFKRIASKPCIGCIMNTKQVWNSKKELYESQLNIRRTSR